MACANGHLNVIKHLVEVKQANLNLKNFADNTPLRKQSLSFLTDWSAVNGLKEVVIYLVEKGADLSVKNNQNKIAAEEAYEKQFYDIAEFLTDKEYELNKGNEKIEENRDIDAEMAEEIENEIKEDMENVDLNK